MKKFATEITLRKIVILAMLIALGVILEIYTIGTNTWQVNMTFVTDTLMGAVGGPLLSGLAGGAQDIIHSLAFSQYGYNWQFTLSTFFVGIIYGFFFYRKKLQLEKWQDWLYVLVAVSVTMLLDSVFFNTLWVSMLYNTPFKVLLMTRLPLLLQILPRTVIIMLVVPALQGIPVIRKFLN